jgi:hypothetical protein
MKATEITEGAPKPKYQVRLNPPKPSAQEIQQQQNFAKVLAQYKAKQRLSPYHSIAAVLRRLFPLLVAAGLLFLLLTYYGKWVKETPAAQRKETGK